MCEEATLDRSLRLKPVGCVLFALVALGVVASATPALAALPRTYKVQRVSSPNPGPGAAFGGGLANVGDLNRDGEEDVAMGQRLGSPNGDGQVYIFSGETGNLIATIPPPDPGGSGSTALFGVPFVDKLSDIGSCPGFAGSAGAPCDPPPTGPGGSIGPKDGVPEIVVGARGIDVPTAGAPGGVVVDVGRVYVFDGATRALVKRIDMPPEDRTALATSSGGTWFGRVAVNPGGLPPCEGNAGIGACPPLAGTGAVPAAVRIGDMDGGGEADIVVGASRYTESSSTAHAGSNCQLTAAAQCIRAGRAYIYRGEEIAGSDPSVILAGTGPGQTAPKKLLNPAAQADNPNAPATILSELFANAIAPVGDLGRCNRAGVAPGDFCGRADASDVGDGRPEIVVAAFRVDLPVSSPDPTLFDVGVNFLIDGATGAVLYDYRHPEPQPGSLFGVDIQGPAVGDLGDTAVPDAYIPAVTQNVREKAEGRGYAMNGAFRTEPTQINFARLTDPTPQYAGNFGAGYAGVGDLVAGSAAPANELLVGGPGIGEPLNPGLLTDIHFFNPATERALQTVPDPGTEPASGFGSELAPLGDLNEDGLLDFAVSAAGHDDTPGGDEGAFYIFRSDNSAPPLSPSAPAGLLSAGLSGGCPGATNAIAGTSGNDTLTGTPAGDEIFAGTGSDAADGVAGNDCLDLGTGDDRGQGGAGDDRIAAGAGADRANGSSGADRVTGGPGPDRIAGGFGDDSLHGQSGSDSVAGSRGRDRINGGAGADSLRGDSSPDAISGDSGDDRIVGGSGRDRLRGNSGNDRVAARDGNTDRISCGTGRDTVVADRSDRAVRDCERVRRVRSARRGRRATGAHRLGSVLGGLLRGRSL